MKHRGLVIAQLSLVWSLSACGSRSFSCEPYETGEASVERSVASAPASSDAPSAAAASGGAEAGAAASARPPVAAASGWLHTQGNKIYHEDGSVFRGRGANIFDTRSCNACTWARPDLSEAKRRVDALIDDWGANFIRLALESYAKPEGRAHYAGVLEDPTYLQDVIELVRHVGTKPGAYVLVALWTDPTLNEKGWPTPRTIPVWERLTEAFVDMPHVLFGIANEPKANYDGSEDEQVWQAMNDTAAAIRAVEARYDHPRHIIAVQGTRKWARHLGYYVAHPITAGGGENIVYETHSYLRPAEFKQNWTGPSEKLPVIIGEFAPYNFGGGKMTVEETIEMMDEAERRDVPWLAWAFHMRCPPNLLKDNSNSGCGNGMALVPTEWGEVIKNRLAEPWKTR